MTIQQSENWTALQQKSTDVLLKFLEEKQPSATRQKQATLASQILRSVTTHESNVNSHERTAVVLARIMYSDADTMNEYIRLAAPRLAGQQKVITNGG